MLNLHTKFELSTFTHYKDTKGNAKCRKWDGHPRSLAMSPFNRAHTTSYSTFNKNYAFVLYHFRVIAHYFPEITYFNLPHLHLVPPLGVPLDFQDLWHQKSRVRELLHGVLCMILTSVVLITILACDRHTHSHTTTAYTALVSHHTVKMEKRYCC